jgi:hypothetical protein
MEVTKFVPFDPATKMSEAHAVDHAAVLVAAGTKPQQSGSEACLKRSKKWVENGPIGDAVTTTIVQAMDA